MNAEINVSRMVPAAGETGFLVTGSQSANAGFLEGQSSFQLLLFQSLAQMSPKEMTDPESTLPDSADLPSESNGLMQEELTGELADLSGILMKVTAEIPVKTVAEIPAKAMTEVSMRAFVGIPVKALEGMPVKAQEEVQMKTSAEVQGKASTEMPAKAKTEMPAKAKTEMPEKASTEVLEKAMTEMPKVKVEVPVKTSTEMLAKDGARAGNTEINHRKKSLEMVEKELPLQATTNLRDTELQTILTKAVEKIEPYNQIGREIQLKLEQKGPMEFKMQLEPKDLGQIDIKLKVNEGKLMIDIMAASSKTHALLAGQVDKLITSMGLQNAEVETVQVELHNGERHSSFQQQPDSREREQNFSGTRYKGDAMGYTESAPDKRVLKNNFTRMDYTI